MKFFRIPIHQFDIADLQFAGASLQPGFQENPFRIAGYLLFHGDGLPVGGTVKLRTVGPVLFPVGKIMDHQFNAVIRFFRLADVGVFHLEANDQGAAEVWFRVNRMRCQLRYSRICRRNGQSRFGDPPARRKFPTSVERNGDFGGKSQAQAKQSANKQNSIFHRNQSFQSESTCGSNSVL